MSVERIELLTKLIDSYEGYFDITRFEVPESDTASAHETDSESAESRESTAESSESSTTAASAATATDRAQPQTAHEIITESSESSTTAASAATATDSAQPQTAREIITESSESSTTAASAATATDSAQFQTTHTGSARAAAFTQPQTAALNPPPTTLAATGDFHSRLEKYVLVRRAQLWATETNEYVYFYTVPTLTAENWQTMFDFTVQNGLSKIKPHKNHMCSYLTAIVIADTVTKSARKALKRSRFFRNFKFSFHGYSMLRACVFSVNGGTLAYNAGGRDVGKNILNLYRGQKK